LQSRSPEFKPQSHKKRKMMDRKGSGHAPFPPKVLAEKKGKEIWYGVAGTPVIPVEAGGF
jgi:hypothetical protein